jgi:peptidoglycan hydrolase-like protein with peptidoglycan-binding domain
LIAPTWQKNKLLFIPTLNYTITLNKKFLCFPYNNRDNNILRKHIMSDPIIKIGSTGDAVKKAQTALIRRFYLVPGTDDGVFGPVTDLAVRNYQSDRSAGKFNAFSFPLKIDGIVGAATWFRLSPVAIKKGSKGSEVRLLQEILKSFSFPPFDPGAVDGDFGLLTESAVKAMQAVFFDFDGNPLVVDGVVGVKTWIALFS